MFERFRPIIMGSKFVRVSGKLQSESDVIHIVAEDFEDLTPWLLVLLEETGPSVADAAGGPASIDPGTEDRRMLAPFVRRNAPVGQGISDDETLTRKAGSVMPKGRNFQ